MIRLLFDLELALLDSKQIRGKPKSACAMRNGMVDQSGPFTVIVFKHMQFDVNWTKPVFWLDDNWPYTATTNGAALMVVEEGATGVMMTYYFKLRKDQVVQVQRDDNLVFIPARCVKKAPGDLTSCDPKG